jgi:hypothetical protein
MAVGVRIIDAPFRGTKAGRVMAKGVVNDISGVIATSGVKTREVVKAGDGVKARARVEVGGVNAGGIMGGSVADERGEFRTQDSVNGRGVEIRSSVNLRDCVKVGGRKTRGIDGGGVEANAVVNGEVHRRVEALRCSPRQRGSCAVRAAIETRGIDALIVLNCAVRGGLMSAGRDESVG